MAKYLVVLFFVVTGSQLFSQQRCSMEEYVNRQMSEDISLKDKLEQAMAHKQELQFTGSEMSMMHIGG